MLEWDYPRDYVGPAKEVTEMDKLKGRKVCQHPERLKGKPGECSPEQIRECHGGVVKHPPVRKK